jgi:peptidoglycan/xylan/chitin deacetylase (PgdA/CDA1 family)
MRRIKNSIKKCIGLPLLLDTICRLNTGVQVIVLGFHDVCEDHSLTSWLRIKKSVFQTILSELKNHCNFIQLDDLFSLQHLSRRRLNLLVTFDDGFANNYRVAMPLLKALGVPALFFVSTGNLQKQSLFWFDRIIIPIQEACVKHLDLTSFGLNQYDFPNPSKPARRWDMIERLLQDIKRLDNQDHPDVCAVLDYFESHFSFALDAHKDEFRPMNHDELRALAENPLFDIGSHSHDHVILTRLPEDALDSNLIGSKAILESIVRKPVYAFACPNGDSTPYVQKRLKAAGYRMAFGTQAEIVNDKADPYDIPRLLIGGYEDVSDIVGKLVRVLFRSKGVVLR